MKGKIEKSIYAILRSKGYDTNGVNLQSALRADVGLDSLDTIELLMELETKYSLTIPDEVSEKFVTVGDVVNYLADKMEHRI